MSALASLAGSLWWLVGVVAPVTTEHWYAMQLDGAPCGYTHESIVATADGGAESRTETHLVLNRLEARLEVDEDDLAHEDAAGRLTALTARLRSSNEDTTLEVEVGPEHLLVTTTAGGRRYQREVPRDGDLLGPSGVRAQTRAWLAAPSVPLRYRLFIAELGRAVEVTRRLVAREPHVGGARFVVEEQVAGVPGRSRLVLDARGEALEERDDSPFGPMTLVASDAAGAHAAAAAGPRTEVFARTLLRANVRLPDPRRLERLRVRLELDASDAGWPDLEGPGQHVLSASATHRELELSRLAPALDAPPMPRRDDPDLVPNVLLQSDHPDVVTLAAQLRRPGMGAFAQSLVVRDWVATHLHFDAGLAVVPAGEVVRDRRGSCVAYAVLTASLARALDIPARVVLGYVYIDGVFGGHAWTEVRVGPDWLPIDAAVYGPGSADPARIALARHGGEQGIGSGALELTRLLGHVTVRIERYVHEGRETVVPPHAAPYRIQGARYTNPWLGLSLERPAGYRFVALDSIYPDATVVGLAGPSGATLRLESHAAGPTDPATAAAYLGAAGYTKAPARVGSGFCASAGDGRSCAWRVGGTLWTLWAGPGDATARLPGVAGSLRFER